MLTLNRSVMQLRSSLDTSSIQGCGQSVLLTRTLLLSLLKQVFVNIAKRLIDWLFQRQNDASVLRSLLFESKNVLSLCRISSCVICCHRKPGGMISFICHCLCLNCMDSHKLCFQFGQMFNCRFQFLRAMFGVRLKPSLIHSEKIYSNSFFLFNFFLPG